MCGFLSSLGDYPLNEKQISILEKSLKLLNHRGPDNTNSKILSDKKCFLGHTRLNILDNNENSNQPIFSDNKKFAMVFNGEIFNHLKLRNLYLKNINFHTNSDTETLIQLWEKFGESSINFLEGMFAFVIIDLHSNDYYCVRDRFGIKPIYYFKKGNNLILSSEIKPILYFLDEKPNINKNVLSDFLSIGMIDHNNKTFFQNINKLDPGTCLKGNINNSSLTKYKWFNLEKIYEESSNKYQNISFDEKLDLLENTLTDVLEEALISNYEIALNLSNGIDSALMQSLLFKKGKKNNSYIQSYDENVDPISKYAPDYLYSLRKEISIKPKDILDNIEKTHFYQEEPYSGLFINGYSKLYEQAKIDGFRVFIDANGLDEFFLGYSKYRKKYPYKLQFTSIDDSYKGGGFLSSEFEKEYLIKKENKLFEHPRDVAMHDLIYYKIPRALRFNDKVSMQNSIELRVPFLDHRILKASMMFNNLELQNESIGKIPLRHILSRNTNKEFAFNKKNHIQSSQSLWLGNELYEFVSDLLMEGWLINNQILSKKKIFNLIKDLRTSVFPNTYSIWQLISTEIWIKELITNYGEWINYS